MYLFEIMSQIKLSIFCYFTITFVLVSCWPAEAEAEAEPEWLERGEIVFFNYGN